MAGNAIAVVILLNLLQYLKFHRARIVGRIREKKNYKANLVLAVVAKGLYFYLVNSYQNVMLEEAEEREREFDSQKKQWNSGSFSYEKIQQYISDLEEERQNVGQLQEKCNALEQKLNELESDNSSLQKKLCEMQTRHKSDSDEREVGEMSFLLLFAIKKAF